MPRSEFHLRRQLVLALTLLLVLSSVDATKTAYLHEEGESWVLSSYSPGELQLSADSASPQWETSKMVAVDEGGITFEMMSVHNETHIEFLVVVDVNASAGQLGLALAFEGGGAGGSDDVWVWDETGAIATAGVETAALRSGDKLLVAFLRAMESSEGGVQLAEGVQYEGLVKVAMWQDGSGLSSLDLESIPHLDLELLPPIDLFPKAPILYSAVLLVGAFGMTYIETRRHR